MGGQNTQFQVRLEKLSRSEPDGEGGLKGVEKKHVKQKKQQIFSDPRKMKVLGRRVCGEEKGQ